MSTKNYVSAGERRLDLDAPVSLYLPQFTGDKGTMSVRQMFSHTAGYGDDSFDAILRDASLTLAQAVDQIACCKPLNAGYSVGGQFSYGGVSMHVGGRVAEVTGGQSWPVGFADNILTPLGATSIDWQGSPGSNWGIAASARSNLRDYGRVLQLFSTNGRGNGKRILAPGMISEILRDQVGNKPIAYAPPNAQPPIRYGLGNWQFSDRPSNAAPLIHSLGGAGYFPWFDAQTKVYGVFMVRAGLSYNAAALPVYTQMLGSIDTEIVQGCAHIELFEEISVDGFEGT